MNKPSPEALAAAQQLNVNGLPDEHVAAVIDHHFASLRYDTNMIIGALDSLGVALADHGHKWTDGEREIYERSLSVLRGERPCEGCGKPSTTSDSEGVPLCDDCARACDEDEL